MRIEKVKKIVLYIFRIFIVLALVMIVFRNDYREIFNCIKNVSITGLIILLVMEIIYLFLDSAACYLLIHSQFPFFKFRQALVVTFIGIFGNVATFSAGIIPMQSYYLYKYGIQVGNSVGMMNLKYIFHKLTIFIYAGVMIFFNRVWIKSAVPELMKYIYIGFGVCAVIIEFLILICTLEPVQKLLMKLIEKLPDTSKWEKRKSVWISNLQALYKESKTILSNKICCINIVAVNLLKLFCLYTIPFVCIKMLNLPEIIFTEIQILSSVMLLITGVLPNIAGLGAAEFSFLLIFSNFMGRIEASSALVLYRTATYFFPFILSIFVVFNIKKIIAK